MKRCESCGREYPDFWLMCPGCLRTLGQPAEAVPPPGKASFWAIPIAAGIVVVCIALFVAARHAARTTVGDFLVLDLYLGSLFWVAWDSNRRDWSRAAHGWRLPTPFWVAATAVFWPLAFPLYTIARRRAPLRSPQPPEL